MNPLYTLGYLAWTPAAVVQCVQDLDAVIADIRFSPSARHLACHRRLMAEACAARYDTPITRLTPPAVYETLALFPPPETTRRPG